MTTVVVFVFLLCFAFQNAQKYPLKSIFYNETNGASCDSNSKCMRKCCGQNYVLKNKTECVFDPSVRYFNESVTFLTGFMKCDGVFRLEPNFTRDVFVVQENGKIVRPNKNKYELDYVHFCLEYFEDMGLSALVCFDDEYHDHKVSKGLNLIGTVISMPFLLVTFIIYTVLPDRNLHRKSLMSYVFTLFLAYFTLTLDQLYFNNVDDLNACKSIGLLCLFFFLTSFFWMNVISIDIWWTFSHLRGVSPSLQSEHRRFLLYNLHSYGVPLVIIILVGSLTFNSAVQYDAWYNPGFGNGRCWFGDSLPRLLYFYGPVAIIIVANIFLFSITAININRVEKDAVVFRRSESKKNCFERDKQKYGMYLKLMLAMGINWSMEIISFIVIWQSSNVPPAVWYLTDFCNAVYGAFIFFVFVFKKQTWLLLKKRHLRGVSPSLQSEHRRFLLYNLHSYGVPLVIIILVGSLTFNSAVQYDAWYNPGFGNGRCWFGDSLPRLLYFYGPVAIIIVANIFLFSITAININRVEKDPVVFRRSESKKNCFERDKQKYGMYLKLMLAMGINWSMEIISFIVIWQSSNVPPAVWYLTDFCNAVYGAFIFFVFVFKKQTWLLLKKRYYLMRGRPLPVNFYNTNSIRNFRLSSVPSAAEQSFKMNRVT